MVKVGDAEFSVELAVTRQQQTLGLSGRPSLVLGTGMLFIYEHEGRYNFWMKEMQFPLDIVWVDSNCRVVDVTLNASPQPGLEPEALTLYSPVGPAQYVLEINAGEAEANSIGPRDPVTFGGELAGQYGC